MPDLPARFAALIITFVPLVVQRSWRPARVLLVGAILAPGRRTVASVLRITGHARDKHFTNYHRVLSRAPWSARGGARIPLGHPVRAFASRGPVVVSLDDTVERRWGPKIAARGIYRDPVRSSHGLLRQAQDEVVKTSGLRWISPMLLAPVQAVPDETAAVARAVFPQGTACLRLRDRLGPVFADERFTSLFPESGQPAEGPWRLALVTLLQFGENLSDRRAADAVRSRIDWKCLLGLSLKDPGFDASVLSEFRSRLVKGGAESLLFDRLLVLCREQGLLAQHGRQRTDSTHVLGAVRTLTRLAGAIEALRAALDALAIAAPDWLRAHAHPAWTERYVRWGGDVHIPKGEWPGAPLPKRSAGTARCC